MPAPFMLPLAFGIPGGYELLIVAFIALLIFGNRLPGVMKSLGKSVTEFKKGVAGIEEDIDSAVTADKKPTATTTTTTTNPTSQPTTHD
jgi:sec-independent protein translocase protein TatA